MKCEYVVRACPHHGSPVVGRGDGPEPLLAGSVPET